MKYILSAFIGFCICLLLTGFFIAQYRPQVGEPVKVIENPAGDRPAIKIKSQGKLSGSILLDSQAKNQLDNPAECNNTPGQNDPLKTPVLTLYDGDKLTVPVSGEVKTEYYNSGKQIGAGTHRIDGETILTASAGSLQTETIFNNFYRITVEVPDPPPKLNRIGVYTVPVLGWSLGGYYQHDWRLTKSISIFGRVEIGSEIRPIIGAKYEF